jgi:hypothetical protein
MTINRILAAISIAVAGAGFTAAALVTGPGLPDGHVQTTALRSHPPHPFQPVFPCNEDVNYYNQPCSGPPGENNANAAPHRPVLLTDLTVHPLHPAHPFQPVVPVSKGGTIPPGEVNQNGDLHRPV